jgi:hypothetical protein
MQVVQRIIQLYGITNGRSNKNNTEITQAFNILDLFSKDVPKVALVHFRSDCDIQSIMNESSCSTAVDCYLLHVYSIFNDFVNFSI